LINRQTLKVELERARVQAWIQTRQPGPNFKLKLRSNYTNIKVFSWYLRC